MPSNCWLCHAELPTKAHKICKECQTYFKNKRRRRAHKDRNRYLKKSSKLQKVA